MPWGGHPQGAPLPIVFSRRYALGRAPTRGAPTNCLLQALCPGEGTHKGRPYRLSFFGVMPWGGRPQGAPLPIVFFRRYALGRAPTRGAPTDCLFSALCPGEGTHKGRPYQLSFFGVMPWGGRPQGAPLPIVFFRRYALGRAPTRGAPIVFFPLCPGEGAHKGRPYQLSFFGVMPWGGRPQGAPLPIVFFRRYALGRAPTRGAPTRFRQPHVVLSQIDAIALLGNPLGLPRNCEMWYIEPTTPTATACQVSCNCLPIIPLATLECESRKERRSIFSRLRSVPSIMVQCTTLSGQGRPISRTRAPFQSQFHPHRSTSTFLLSAHGAVPFRFADARRANPMHGLTTDGLTTEGLYQCW